MQINFSLRKTLDHPFSLSLQRLPWDSLGTKNLSSYTFTNIFKSKQIMAAEKI